MKKKAKAEIEFTKESGEVVLIESYPSEFSAQVAFDELEKIRYPMTYKGLTMNLSEYDNAGTIGAVQLVVTSETGKRFERRELFRKA